MKKPIPPCLDCPDHKVGCHGKCEKYIQYKEDQKKWNDIVYENEHNDVEMSQVEKRRFSKWNDAKKRGRIK